MAESKTTKSKATKAKKTVDGEEVVAKTPAKKIVPKEIDLSQYIPVRNGFHGMLIYRSKRTREEFVWHEFGDIQEIELKELRNAKSASKGFFTNNWFMFDDEYAWVIDYLGLGQYYKNAVSVDGFDSIFFKEPDEIEEIIGGMTSGQKSSAAYRAHQLVADNQIDSRGAIAAIEKALGIQLVEH